MWMNTLEIRSTVMELGRIKYKYKNKIVLLPLLFHHCAPSRFMYEDISRHFFLYPLKNKKLYFSLYVDAKLCELIILSI